MSFDVRLTTIAANPIGITASNRGPVHFLKMDCMRVCVRVCLMKEFHPFARECARSRVSWCMSSFQPLNPPPQQTKNKKQKLWKRFSLERINLRKCFGWGTVRAAVVAITSSTDRSAARWPCDVGLASLQEVLSTQPIETPKLQQTVWNEERDFLKINKKDPRTRDSRDEAISWLISANAEEWSRLQSSLRWWLLKGALPYSA